MIDYSYDEEKLMALFFADLLHDELARKIIEAGMVANSAEATPIWVNFTGAWLMRLLYLKETKNPCLSRAARNTGLRNYSFHLAVTLKMPVMKLNGVQ